MIFEPLPLEYFPGANARPRLMRLREKEIELAKLPVDNLLIVRFNRYFTNYDAEQFVDNILIIKLNVKHLVIGDDFHFRKARRGNFAMLKKKDKAHGFKVEDTGSYQFGGLCVNICSG